MPQLICLYKGTRNLEIDTDATMSGYISISPINVELTNYYALDTFKKKVG